MDFGKWFKRYYCLVVGKLRCVMESVTEIWLRCDALPEELLYKTYLALKQF